MLLLLLPSRADLRCRFEPLFLAWHGLVSIFLLTCLFSVALPVAAADRQVPDALDLIPGLMVLRDRSAALDFEAVTSPAMLSQWQVADDMPNFGMTKDALWLALAVSWPEQAESRWLVQIVAPLTDKIDVFRFELDTLIDSARRQDGRGGAPLLVSNPSVLALAVQELAGSSGLVDVDRMEMGARFAFSQRPVSQHDFSFWIEPAANRLQWIVIRMESSLGLRAPVKLVSEKRFLSESGLQHLVQGGYLGLMAFIALLSFGVYCVTRDFVYLTYTGFVIITSLFLLVYKGYAFEYLWPNSPDWSVRSFPVTMALACLMSVLFAFAFLRLRQNASFAYWLAMPIALLWIPLALYAAFGDYRQALFLLAGLVPAGAGTLFLAAFICLYRGVPGAAYYCVGWIAVLLGGIVVILIETGMLTVTDTTPDILQIACVFECIALAFALGARLNRQLRERATATRTALESLNTAQIDIIEAQTQTRQQLEDHVRERTQALEQTMVKLADANMELKLLSTTDELTQLSNRRSVNATLDREWARSARSEGSLSVILLDLDYFKLVNDQYGHPCGDKVLRTIASLLAGAVQRPGDLVGRYGGEEFIIVLADTPPNIAAELAERIRSKIENTVIHAEATSLNVTASFGVASCNPFVEGTKQRTDPLFSNPDALVDAADRALYLAKQRGRNQVVVMD